MAVVSVEETWFDREGDGDALSTKEYRRYFNVMTDDKTDGPVVVLYSNAALAFGLPSVYDFYEINDNEQDFGSLCEKKEARQDPENYFLWRVTVYYSSKVLDPNFFPENPLDKPAEIIWDGERYRRPLYADVLTGAATTNSAGQAFDPPLEVDDSRATLTIIKNTPDFDVDEPSQYQNTVNADPFMGQDVGTVKCDKIAGRRLWQGGQMYWQRTYSFSIRSDGWTLKPLDQGFCQLDASNKLVPMRDLNGTGVVLAQQSLLDGTGHQLAHGANPVYLSYTGYLYETFANLNLP